MQMKFGAAGSLRALGLMGLLALLPAVAAPASFVTTCGTRLCIGGNSCGNNWTIHGATVYHMYENLSWELSQAKDAGINVFHAIGWQYCTNDPNCSYDGNAWQRVDRLVSVASQNNMRVLLDLSDYAHGLISKGIRPTDPGQLQGWYNLLNFAANRVNTITGQTYKNDPTIAMVAIYGEADTPNGGAPTRPASTQELTDFYKNTLAHWRSVAPNILAQTGGLNYLDQANAGGIDWKAIIADPNNAMASLHIGSDGDINITTPMVAAYCRQINKPLLCEAWSSCQSSDGAKAAHAQRIFDLIAGTNATQPPVFVGELFWNLGDSTGTTCDISSYFPQTWNVVKSHAPTPMPTCTDATPTLTLTPIPAPQLCSWQPVGSAFADGRGITLTSHVSSQAGAAWAPGPLDLSKDFNFTFQVNLGSDLGGGDGLDFVLQRDPRGTAALGGYGSDVGYGGLNAALTITPSVAIRFQTWNTNGKVQAMENGIGVCGTGISNPCPYTLASQIKNGQFHSYNVIWTAATNTLVLKIDSVQVLTFQRDILWTIFNGNKAVYFGMTAGTGGSSNIQSFYVPSCPYTPPPTPTPTAVVTAGPTPNFCSWALAGSAVYGGNGITLTAHAGGQAGAAWNTGMADLVANFSYNFQVNFGDDLSGGDGIVFVLQRDPRGLLAVGNAGGDKGYAGKDGGVTITPSVAFAIEDWSVSGTVKAMENGLEMCWPYVSPASCQANVSKDVKDGKFHAMNVAWNVTATTLTLSFDGTPLITYTRDLRGAVFGGQNRVYFGLTAGTGGASNMHSFYLPSCPFTPIPTFTASPSRTPTPGPTGTSTPTVTRTATRTATRTSSATPTVPASSATTTLTFTGSRTASPTVTRTYTPSSTGTVSRTGTATPTSSPSSTPSSSRTASSSPTRSRTSSPTHSPTRSATPSATPSASRTTTRTSTPSISPTFTDVPLGSTLTDTPTFSPTFSYSPSATASSSPTPTLSSSPTHTASPSPEPSATGTQSATGTASPSATDTTTKSSTATPSPSPSSTPTASATLSPSSTSSRTFTSTSSPTRSVSPSPTGSFTPSISPSFTQIAPDSTATSTPSASPSTTRSPTTTLSASPTRSKSVTPSHSRSATPSASRTLTPFPTPAASATASPAPSAAVSATPSPRRGRGHGHPRPRHVFAVPNPQSGPWLRLAVDLDDDALAIEVKLYSKAMTALDLVKLEGSFKEGWNRVEFPLSSPLPSGLYYVLVSARGEGGSQFAEPVKMFYLK